MKIVIFHMSTLGDLLFSLPAVEALRLGFPQAPLTSVVAPAFAELLATTRLVDDVVARQRNDWHGAAHLFGELRPRKFDLAVCFSQSRASALHALASGAARRVGFARSRFGWTLTEKVPFDPPPSLENNLRLVRSLGCEPRRKDYVGLVRPNELQHARAADLLAGVGLGDEKFAVIATGASAKRSLKEWTPDGFARVIHWLKETKGWRCVAVGTERPVELLEQAGEGLADLCGQTSLPELAAVLERAALFVGIDSGVMHLAAAMGTPVVGIFGPTDPRHTGPRGDRARVVRRDLPCSPCLNSWCTIKTRECLEALSAEEVINGILRLQRTQNSQSIS